MNQNLTHPSSGVSVLRTAPPLPIEGIHGRVDASCGQVSVGAGGRGNRHGSWGRGHSRGGRAKWGREQVLSEGAIIISPLLRIGEGGVGLVYVCKQLSRHVQEVQGAHIGMVSECHLTIGRPYFLGRGQGRDPQQRIVRLLLLLLLLCCRRGVQCVRIGALRGGCVCAGLDRCARAA